MSRNHIFCLTSCVLIASVVSIPQPSIGDPCGCPCYDGCCYWDPTTGIDCGFSTEPSGPCECEGGRCPTQSYIEALYPLYNQYLISSQDPPPGGCCQTGCGGVCFNQFENPCWKLFACRKTGSLACDGANPCSFQPILTHMELQWWSMGTPCCVDIQ